MESADPFDQRRHVGLSELLAELHQNAFPIPELLACGDHIGVQNVDLPAKNPDMTARGVPGDVWHYVPADVAQLDRMALR